MWIFNKYSKQYSDKAFTFFLSLFFFKFLLWFTLLLLSNPTQFWGLPPYVEFYFYGQEKDFVFISAVKKVLKNEGGRVSDLKKKIKS